MDNPRNPPPARMRDRSRRSRTAALTLACALAACAPDVPTRGWSGRVDTLPDGVIVVHNPATGTWDSTTAWQVVEQHRIGSVDGQGPDAFGQIWTAVEDARGRTWVLDRQASAIPVFDSTGTWVRTVGREGAGPGEFRRPLAVLRAPDDRMWVVDPGNARYSVYDTAGTWLTSFRREISSTTVPWPGGFDDQGRLYDVIFTTVPERTRSLVRHEFDDSVTVVDTLRLPDPPGEEDDIRGEIPGGFLVASVPYGSRFAWAFVPDGRIVFGMTGDYRIHVAPIGGPTTRIIEREFTPVPVSSDERAAAFERMRSYIDQGLDFAPSMIPDNHPAVATFFIDDAGYLWVQPLKPDAADDSRPGLRLVDWDIFDPDGRYLGRLTDLPPSLSIRGNSITGHTTDELGVPYVVRYRIMR